MTGICPGRGYIVGMAKRGGSAHVATIKTKGKGGAVYTSQLLRRSYRDAEGKVGHEHLGNLSRLPAKSLDVIREMLARRRPAGLDSGVVIGRPLPHVHV